MDSDISAGMSSSFNALIVENDEAIVQPLRAALVKLGCEVRASDAVASAKMGETVNGQKIDVAFVPLTLRGASGRSIARNIRGSHPHSKIFLMTSWEGELDRDILNAEGFAGVIRKPLRFSELKRMLIEHLG